MNCELVWEPHGVVLCFNGQVSINDILYATIAYQADPRFDDLLFVIADYSQITGCVANQPDIEVIWVADSGAAHTNPKIRKAVVTTSSDVIALAMQYKGIGTPAFPVEIFATQSQARAWLLGKTSEFSPHGRRLAPASVTPGRSGRNST